MDERLSIAASTSGGRLTFSTTKVANSMPYFAVVTGLISGSSAPPSSLYCVATSSTGIFACASASLKSDTIRERMVSANSSSRKWWSLPATSFKKSFGSVMRKSYVPKARARTMPKSLSRIITGFEVPQLLPVKRRVVT